MFFSGIFVWNQSGDHPWEDVGKVRIIAGRELKYKSLIIHLHFWLHNDKPKI